MLTSNVAHASRLRLCRRWVPARGLSEFGIRRSGGACPERSRMGMSPAISSLASHAVALCAGGSLLTSHYRRRKRALVKITANKQWRFQACVESKP